MAKKTKKQINAAFDRNQMRFMFDWYPPLQMTKMIRSCPKNSDHRVYGDCFFQGGRRWYCSECGIEWSANIRSGVVRYDEIQENGETRLLKKVSLRFYPEIQQVLKKSIC